MGYGESVLVSGLHFGSIKWLLASDEALLSEEPSEILGSFIGRVRFRVRANK